ncbi:DUF1997 domain-containing protein [Lusitaniella coriacea LEGE 07157]|uniref:DUF1997 domain-containing protein n=1 Tax=Lusitaniella coriacea LEGE 07157 TaxID=945747 RepID=A0A8J7JDE6_9CYAN|nr:DUF1997 domain-containing protein [Lusitaniella coriacea]MBE9118225.1 DUF1997 domain-containing protein [Lusitaniella coriacea LEGE 07157]
MQNLRFTASESLEIAVEEQNIPIQHYLRQPERLVRAIADPKLMESLPENRYRLKMRPLNFMNLYRFQPTVILKVWTTNDGTMRLQSESCEIRGIDYINQRFSLAVTGKLAPTEYKGKTYLKGRSDVTVTVDIPPILWLTPTPILEVTGNSLLKSVLLRIKQRILSHLLKDYRQWSDSSTHKKSSTQLSNVRTV